MLVGNRLCVSGACFRRTAFNKGRSQGGASGAERREPSAGARGAHAGAAFPGHRFSRSSTFIEDIRQSGCVIVRRRPRLPRKMQMKYKPVDPY